MKRLFLIGLTALAACGTPQEQCINRNTRDLRTVDRLIVETQGNLQRGYAIDMVTRTEEFLDVCLDRVAVNGQITVQPRSCWRERSFTVQRPRAIDLKAEAQKLEGLKSKRTELARAAKPLIAQCRAEFPD